MTKDDKKMKPTTTRLLVTMALAAQAGLVAAQETATHPAVDTSKWECRFCPSAQWYVGTVDVGAVNTTGAPYKFSRYTGLENGTSLGLDATTSYSDGPSYYNLSATNAGLPYRALEFEGGTQGKVEVKLRYAELPFMISDTGSTPFRGIGTSSLSLPSYWLTGVNTGAMPSLASSLLPVQIDSKRKQGSLDISLIPERDWKVGINVKQETRTGARSLSGAFFFNTMQLVAPVEYQTQNVESYASYATSRWQVRFALEGSAFNDENAALTWQNPYAQAVPGVAYGRLALPPSNQFYQLSAAGAYQIAARTRLSANYAVGRMEQNDAFLAATVNPVLAPIALPRGSLEGKVDTTQANVKLVTALMPRWGLDLSYAYDDRANKTPQSLFNWVTTDMLVATPQVNLPYSYTRKLLKASTDYRFTARSRGSVGIDNDVQDRTYEEIAKTTENTAWAKFTANAFQIIDVTAKVAHGRRRGSDYQAVPQLAVPNNPLLMKYNLADRDRNTASLQVALMPAPFVTVSADYSLSKEDYSNSAVGLTWANRQSYGGDVALSLGEGASAHLYYNMEEIRSHQVGAQSFSNAPDWYADNVDTVETSGVGLRQALIPDRLDIGADLTSSRSAGDIRVATTATDPAFPRIKANLYSLKLQATYRFTRMLALRGAVWHERYSSSNWALDGVGVSTIPNVLALGETSPIYTVNVASATLRYSF